MAVTRQREEGKRTTKPTRKVVEVSVQVEAVEKRPHGCPRKKENVPDVAQLVCFFFDFIFISNESACTFYIKKVDAVGAAKVSFFFVLL